MILLWLFLEFFKIGLFCFGGAFGMIPLIRETVLAHGWLTEEAFYNFIGVCESTPGPIAVNMATYIGSTQAGLPGSIAATLGVVLPSFLIILLIASVMKHLTEQPAFKRVMKGVKPVIVGLILSTGAVMFLKALGVNTADPASTALSFQGIAVMVLLIGVLLVWEKLLKKKLPSVALILIAAALGVASGFVFPAV